jgi:hypothetical protein
VAAKSKVAWDWRDSREASGPDLAELPSAVPGDPQLQMENPITWVQEHRSEEQMRQSTTINK